MGIIAAPSSTARPHRLYTRRRWHSVYRFRTWRLLARIAGCGIDNRVGGCRRSHKDAVTIRRPEYATFKRQRCFASGGDWCMLCVEEHHIGSHNGGQGKCAAGYERAQPANIDAIARPWRMLVSVFMPAVVSPSSGRPTCRPTKRWLLMASYWGSSALRRQVLTPRWWGLVAQR